MISVIIIWVYILVTTYSAGHIAVAAGRRAGIIDDAYKPDPPAYVLTGLVAVTVYAEVWSLFGKVGPAANIVFVLLCVAGTVLPTHFVSNSLLDQILNKICRQNRPGDTHVTHFVPALVIFLIMAYGTSHGIMHYDTSLYHAQAIRWIEEYGLVPGLANLHTRLGYNSSAFVLGAFYSFAFTGQSYHVTGGFCALLLAWECMAIPYGRIAAEAGTGTDSDQYIKGSHPMIRKRIQGCISVILSVPGMARLAGIYYLLMIYDEMVSPASDYHMVCLAFILIIRWLDMTEDQSGCYFDRTIDQSGSFAALSEQVMLSFFACFILTVKLSGALLLLLAAAPAVMLIRRRDFKRTAKCLLTGTVIIAPYLIRNFFLSGWLLYPSTILGIFDTDWRVPEDIAMYDYKEIQVYGRGYTDVSRYDEPLTVWLKDWLGLQSSTDRILIVLACVGAVIFMLYYIVEVFRSCVGSSSLRDNTDRSRIDGIYRMFPYAVLCICFAFWILTSPLMRYGCLYVYLTDAVTWGGLACLICRKNRYAGYALISAITLFAGYKACMWGAEVYRGYRSDTWIAQQDYDNFETFPYHPQGSEVTLYAPVSGDRTGYEPFPTSPWDMNDAIELRGDSLNDGFRHK